MTHTTIEEARHYRKIALNWLKTHHKSYIFNDCKYIAELTVAEYLANQDEKTLYEKDT